MHNSNRKKIQTKAEEEEEKEQFEKKKEYNNNNRNNCRSSISRIKDTNEEKKKDE